MPYITDNGKKEVDPDIEGLVDQILLMTDEDSVEGVMNYTISTLCNEVMIGDAPRYKKINRVIGVLEAVKLEFYRRLVAPYEDQAVQKNGDIKVYEKYPRVVRYSKIQTLKASKLSSYKPSPSPYEPRPTPRPKYPSPKNLK